jgi:lipopolysaccharide export system protein LptC
MRGLATFFVGGRRPLPEGPALARLSSRYSRFVDLMRILLPAVAAALIAVVALWPHLTGGYGSLIIPMLRNAEIDGIDAMRMRHPRYVGQTSHAEPYAVTAEEALVDPAAPELIRLDRLAASITTVSRREVRLVALSGLYDREQEELDLAGGVELTTSDGYRFATETAKIDLRQGRVVGRTPIAGSGPAGDLAAGRFEIREGGDVLFFAGRVKVTVLPGAGGAGGS